MENCGVMVAIVLVVWLLMEVYKAIFKDNEVCKSLIPAIAGFIGGVCGVCLFIYFPETIAAGNAVEGLVIGIISGLSATGCNEVVSQIRSLK